MKNHIAMLAAVLLLVASNAHATIIWQDNFDSYGNVAAVDAGGWSRWTREILGAILGDPSGSP
jgi:hypothetical protein